MSAMAVRPSACRANALWAALAGGLLAALAAASVAPAAALVPLDGAAGYDFACLSERAPALGTVLDDGQVRLQALPAGTQAAAALAGKAYVFADGSTYEALPTGQCRLLAPLGAPVRAAAPAGTRLALLMGGTWQAGRLRGAAVNLWTPPAGLLSPATQVRPVWDPCSLHAAADGLQLLVGVRKTTHFDPVERLRPFLYRFTRSTLEPVWKGTSFARPHVAAVLLDLAAEPGAEACALEWLPDGRKQVAAYAWTGTHMEAVAASEPAPFGDTLQPVGPDALGLFRADGAGWQFGLLRWGNQPDRSGVHPLDWAAMGPATPARPAAWTTVRRGDRAWLVTAAATGAEAAVSARPILP
jgi:hypothetical protein